jgi:hypothetical protein
MNPPYSFNQAPVNTTYEDAVKLHVAKFARIPQLKVPVVAAAARCKDDISSASDSELESDSYSYSDSSSAADSDDFSIDRAEMNHASSQKKRKHHPSDSSIMNVNTNQRPYVDRNTRKTMVAHNSKHSPTQLPQQVTSQHTNTSQCPLSIPATLPEDPALYRSSKDTFGQRLYRLVHYCELRGLTHAAAFTRSGIGFTVRDPVAFVNTVLPHFFRKMPFEDFTRYLLAHDFDLVDSGNDLGAFVHPYFKRSDTSLLYRIHRKDRKPNEQSDLELLGGPDKVISAPSAMK